MEGWVEVVGGGGGVEGVVEREMTGLGEAEEGSDLRWMLVMLPEGGRGKKTEKARERRGEREEGRKGRAHRSVLLLARGRAKQAFHLKSRPYLDGSI